ncbi:MAG: apolipoprotein N-acyltransferase [Pseudomonadota bacterium]
MLKFLFFFVLAYLGGVIYATGFPSVWIPTFIAGPIIGMALFLIGTSLFRTRKKPSFVQELILFLAFSAGAYTFAYYWVPNTLKVFGAIPYPAHYFLGSLLSLIIFPHLLLLLILIRFSQIINIPFKFVVNSPNKRNLFIALLFCFLEYYTPQQFPAHMGHSWLVLAPNLGMAPYCGVILFSFISGWLAMAAATFFTSLRVDRFAILATILFLGANFALPLKFSPVQSGNYKSNHLRLVQANVGNFMKMDATLGGPKSLQEVDFRYYDLSTRPSLHPIDLLIWPETSYPHTFNTSALKDNSAGIPRLVKEVILESKAELFMGGYDSLFRSNDNFFETDYNAALLLGSQKSFTPNITQNPNQLIFDPQSYTTIEFKDVYHKRRLIPFGETLPFGRFNEYLARYIRNISFFKTGDRYTLFTTRNQTHFISAICYEILFSESIRTYLNSVRYRPHFIVNLSNDSWYGNTAQPLQHLFLAHWRALEFQLPIVRMTNSGISSILYPDGQESRRLAYETQDILDVTLTTPNGKPTFYQEWGTLPVLGIWFFFLILILIFGRSSAKKEPFLE